jgi:hypothetical protein
MNKRKFVFDIGPPLLASDLNVLIGLKKKKIIESIPEPKFDVSDVESIKQAVFENEGIRLPPASNLNQHPDLVFGRPEREKGYRKGSFFGPRSSFDKTQTSDRARIGYIKKES